MFAAPAEGTLKDFMEFAEMVSLTTSSCRQISGLTPRSTTPMTRGRVENPGLIPNDLMAQLRPPNIALNVLDLSFHLRSSVYALRRSLSEQDQ